MCDVFKSSIVKVSRKYCEIVFVKAFRQKKKIKKANLLNTKKYKKNNL